MPADKGAGARFLPQCRLRPALWSRSSEVRHSDGAAFDVGDSRFGNG